MSRFISLFFLFFAITYHVGNCGNKKKIKKLEKDLKNLQQLFDEHMGGFYRDRVNVATLDSTALENLNDALGAMKSKTDPDDWTSFQNVANYHGSPHMCHNDWNVTYPYGPYGKWGCCVHHDPYFVAWHRLFIVNFEVYLGSAFGDSSIAVPYWDWTEMTNTPSGLPTLVEHYLNWKKSHIKGEVGKITHRNPGNNFKKPANIETLKSQVQTAYCISKTYNKYNTQTQIPHDAVHNWLGGSMPRTSVASYDPIFYLHHSFVDQQYAYWQELQNLRDKPQLGQSPMDPNREMPPFSDYTASTISPNPLYITKEYDTQALGLDYRNHFSYRYNSDHLVFDGLTPQQFLAKYGDRCHDKFQIGLTPVDYKIRSRNTILANYGGSSFDVAEHITFAMLVDTDQGIHHVHDVTKFFDSNNIDLENSKPIHYEVKSYDEYDQEIQKNLYKPTFEFYDKNEKRTIRYHVSQFDQYCPTSHLEYCEDIILEFLEDDGSYSTGVTSDGTAITSPYHVSKTVDSQEFSYGGFTIKLIYTSY